jgi:methanogenic corrinoid protein MtbC1
MLLWCSYCQHFGGEVPPYDNLTITHGICADCEPTALTLSDSDFARVRTVRDVQDRLHQAGSHGDLEAARRIIEDARAVNMREVDVLIGIMAPLLYQIGEDWKRGAVTVAEEHRFTAFCERVLELVNVKVATVAPAPPADVLLVNAPGNRHTLAVRILALWLMHRDIPARAVEEPLDTEDVVALVGGTQPKLLLVSLALAEQTTGVAAIAGRVATLPEPIRPKIVVGGYAVKVGLVTAIPGADLMPDINLLARRQPTALG